MDRVSGRPCATGVGWRCYWCLRTCARRSLQLRLQINQPVSTQPGNRAAQPWFPVPLFLVFFCPLRGSLASNDLHHAPLGST
jgi:hypothetical protein